MKYGEKRMSRDKRAGGARREKRGHRGYEASAAKEWGENAIHRCRTI
jgi:hypothetical protein